MTVLNISFRLNFQIAWLTFYCNPEVRSGNKQLAKHSNVFTHTNVISHVASRHMVLCCHGMGWCSITMRKQINVECYGILSWVQSKRYNFILTPVVTTQDKTCHRIRGCGWVWPCMWVWPGYVCTVTVSMQRRFEALLVRKLQYFIISPSRALNHASAAYLTGKGEIQMEGWEIIISIFCFV